MTRGLRYAYCETLGLSRKCTGRFRILWKVSFRSTPLNGVVAYCKHKKTRGLSKPRRQRVLANDRGTKWKHDVRSSRRSRYLASTSRQRMCVQTFVSPQARYTLFNRSGIKVPSHHRGPTSTCPHLQCRRRNSSESQQYKSGYRLRVSAEWWRDIRSDYVLLFHRKKNHTPFSSW